MIVILSVLSIIMISGYIQDTLYIYILFFNLLICDIFPHPTFPHLPSSKVQTFFFRNFVQYAESVGATCEEFNQWGLPRIVCKPKLGRASRVGSVKRIKS